jgi:glycosyltransferase involved in cell wall biosynthesis
VTESRPLITIVTPSFNQAALLAGAIANVQAQGCSRVQHIVVDGGSTDGTVDLLRGLGDAVTWVSEPDRGQAHAINKGFEMADGQILAWINCDDRYTPGALDFVQWRFAETPASAFLFGDAIGADLRGREYGLRAHVRACGLDDLVTLGDPIVQPAAFWTRELWSDVGELDEDLHYAFDYEYWMRVAAICELDYVPVCLAIESLHGQAKSSNGDLVRMREIEAVARRHGGSGVPSGFRAEAAALESAAAVNEFVRGRLSEAGRHASAAVALRPSPLRFAAHAIAHLMPLREAVPRLRLLANQARSPRVPTYPAPMSTHARTTTSGPGC